MYIISIHQYILVYIFVKNYDGSTSRVHLNVLYYYVPLFHLILFLIFYLFTSIFKKKL